MDEKTIQTLMRLVMLVAQLAPAVISHVEGVRQQTGKSVDEIFTDAGATYDANSLIALQILVQLAAPALPSATVVVESPPVAITAPLVDPDAPTK